MKTELLQIRLTEEDREALERLSRYHGVSMAGVIRMLIRQADRDIEATEASALPKELALATMN